MRRGQQVSYEQFVRDNARWLSRFAVALTGDAGLAEELVQDVLLKVHQRWPRIEALDAPPSYVRRMLVNEHISWRRKWSRFIPTATVLLADDSTDHAQRHVDHDELIRALRQLPPRQQAVLALRFFEGFADDQIADLLRCKPGTVRSLASRALATLREQRAEYAHDEEGSPSS
jgi:RNA polymerase sigma-70 factor (sigma-E family)